MSTERKSAIQSCGARKVCASLTTNEVDIKKSKMGSTLEQLKALTTVVADTGDIECK